MSHTQTIHDERARELMSRFGMHTRCHIQVTYDLYASNRATASHVNHDAGTAMQKWEIIGPVRVTPRECGNQRKKSAGGKYRRAGNNSLFNHVIIKTA